MGETADMAIQAALTGHLVLSTLHTNDAPSAITRLLELGVPAYLIRATLIGVLAQRLVRTLCPDCRASVGMSKEYWSQLGVGSAVAMPADRVPRPQRCVRTHASQRIYSGGGGTEFGPRQLAPLGHRRWHAPAAACCGGQDCRGGDHYRRGTGANTGSTGAVTAAGRAQGRRLG